MRCTLLLLMLSLSLGLQGCSTNGQPSAANRPSLDFKKADLPNPAELPARAPSAVPQPCPIQDGAAYDSSRPSNRVQVNAAALDFQPGNAPGQFSLGTSAYAIYSFDVSNFLGSPVLHSIWSSAPAAGTAWVGFANFTQQRWDWVALDAGGSADMPSLPDYILSGNTLYAVLLVGGTGNATLDLLFLGDPMLCDALIAPSTVELNSTLHFNGGFVPGETITQWEWDVEGDSVYESLQPGALDATFNFGSGDFHPALRVQTAEGNSYTASTTVHVVGGPHNWVVSEVCLPASADESFSHPQLAVIGGRPALGYIYSFNGNEVTQAYKQLQIRRADAPVPTAWLDPLSPDTISLDMTRLYALEDYYGRAAVLLQDPLSGNLVFCITSDTMLSSWIEPIYLPSSLGSERCADMARIGNEIAIARITGNGRFIILYSAPPPFFSLTSEANQLPQGGLVGGLSYTELALAEINGRAAIASSIDSSGSYSVSYARATDAHGSAPWDLDVYAHGTFSLSPCLAPSAAGGKPLIAASDGNNSFYSYSSVADGGVAADWTMGDPVLDTSRWIDLGPDGGGLPQCLVNQSSGGNAVGVNWISGVVNSYEEIDHNFLGLGDRCVVTTCEGTPIVAYEDPTTGGIKVAVLF